MINKQLSIIPTRIRPSCDQCYDMKRKCNLIIPTCSRCKEKSLKCTRDRKGKRKPIMCDNQDFHSKSFLLFQSNKVKRERKIEVTIILNYKYFNNPKISPGGCRFNYNVSIASIFPIKSFHCPILFDQSSDLFYKIAPNKYLTSFFNNLPPVESKCIATKDNNNFYYNIIQLIAVYFQNINILLPLFTYNQFLSKKRDIILVYSIMLVALTHIDDSSKSSNLKLALRDIILKHFKPGELKINLSNIQSMVVLFNGLKGSDSALPSYYFSNLNNYCMMLGLHLKYSNDNERKLCYSAVVFLLSIDDPYSNLLFNTHNLWKNDMVISTLSNNESIESIIQLVLVIYSKYCYDCSLFHKYFFDTLLHFNTLNIKNANAVKISHLLGTLLHSIIERAISKYKVIKKAASNKMSGDIIDILINHIKIVYHSYKAALNVIKWLALNDDKDKLFSKDSVNERSKSLKDLEDLEDLEANIQSFITHSSNLKTRYFSSIRYFSFLIVINIISSHSKWINNSNVLLNRTLIQFNKLARNNGTKLIRVIEFILQLCTSK
ncbi:hypothetical protein K502DRAFT_353842 [Neoconidiobolus thromboides FSU 785]|nr:hypothetical protein K502DRAFT_353842 [Neoconidiobolus thromboides FSU 785]